MRVLRSHIKEREADIMPDNYNEYTERPSFQNDDAPEDKTPKNHRGLKAIAWLLVIGIIGGGSFQAYRIFKDTENKFDYIDISEEQKKNKPEETVNADINVNNEPRNVSNAALPSLLSIASRKDAMQLPDIVDKIMPSVVGVSATFNVVTTVTNWSFFGLQQGTEEKQYRSTGTGIIMKEDGYIVTNAHVVYTDEYKAGQASEVSVLLSDETRHDAKIIAYDKETDIAILKIDASGLTPAEFGDSNDLRVGELVVAVGNPLGFELFGSVTFGIVSALNREITVNEKTMSLIQTDAAINSGNSGGPLLNSCGQVIGINSAKMSSSYNQENVEGLGFAIPITDAKVIIDDLIENGYVTGRPKLGFSSYDISEIRSIYTGYPMGVCVCDLEKGGAADLAGIRVNDVIIEIDNEPVTTAKEMNKIKDRHKAGDTINITINRDGQDIRLQVTLQESIGNEIDKQYYLYNNADYS